MRLRQGNVLETLRRLQGFMERNAELLVSFNASSARASLDRCVAQFTTHTVDQDAGLLHSKAETSLYRALRRTLRQAHLRPIAAIAHAHLRAVPELSAFRLPKIRTKPEALIAAAASMAEAASPHQHIFKNAGMPDDFLVRLAQAAEAVKNVIDQRAMSRGRRVGATGGLGSEEGRGRDLIRVLDALVVPALEDRTDLLAEWKALKRIHAKPGAPSGKSRKKSEDTEQELVEPEVSAPNTSDAAPAESPVVETAA